MEEKTFCATNLNPQAYWSLFTIVLFLSAGLPFIVLPPSRYFFLALTPFTLSLISLLLIFNHSGSSKGLAFYSVAAFSVGMLVEIIGVKYGFLFGHYQYGATLWGKICGVPFIIGVNWLLLTYICGNMAAQFFPKFSIWAKAAYASSLMVLFDVVLEPIAIQFDFWQWHNHVVPYKNYVAWWGIAFLLLLLFFYLPFSKTNKLSTCTYIALFGFFFMLNLLV